ncbi:MAG: PAS domain-containing sensor histidine kinase [Dehalococcoidales bacterium]|nr:PAS domain-containing sensor histidine kinase [Dehalococcoidales bacterium]
MTRDQLIHFWHQFLAFHLRFNERAFRIIFSLVIILAILHGLGEVSGVLSHLGLLYYLTIFLFFLPVVYAAISYGFTGASATAIWVMIVTIPDWALWHYSLDARLGVIFFLLVVNGLAMYIGFHIDREMTARHNAEVAAESLRVSEERYRDLFISSPVPILALDLTGKVLDLNPEAKVLFGTKINGKRAVNLAELIGEESSLRIIDTARNGSQPIERVSVELPTGLSVNLKPSVNQSTNSAGEQIIQVAFRDITEDYHRQASLKAYAALLIRTQEEERQRIARELHDDTIQSMVTLCRLLDEARDSGDAPNIAELNEARSISGKIVDGLRVFTTLLRPPYLDDLGIISAIRGLLRDVKKRTGIETGFTVKGKYRRLSSDLELGIFRIAQEALRNAEKHSKSKTITVTLQISRGELSLEVLDDGSGFIIPRPNSKNFTTRHMGIIGMRERAELIGGSLDIQSRDNSGTRISLVVPT